MCLGNDTAALPIHQDLSFLPLCLVLNQCPSTPPGTPQRRTRTFCRLQQSMFACFILEHSVCEGYGCLLLLVYWYLGLLPSCPCSDPQNTSSGLLGCEGAPCAFPWGKESHLESRRISVQAVSSHCCSHRGVTPSFQTTAGEQTPLVHPWKTAHFWVIWLLFRRKTEGRSFPI